MVGSDKHCVLAGCTNQTNGKGPICKEHYSKLTQEIREAIAGDAHSLAVIRAGRGTVRKPFQKALYRAMKCIELGKAEYRRQYGG